jgi:hypothetical protein
MEMQQAIFRAIALGIALITGVVVGFRAIHGFWEPVSCGLLLGSAAAFLNTAHLYWRIVRLGEAAMSNVFNSGSIAQQRRSRSLGFATRISIALLAAATAIRFPAYLDVKYTIIGLIWVPVAAWAVGLWYRRRPSA